MVKLKKLSIIFLTLILFVIGATKTVNAAGTIQSIDIVAQIQDDGSVIITDHRKFTAEKGTEHYIALGNLPGELKDFKVYENGVALEYKEKWDINASIEEKAGKYGINRTSKGIELCFGIGKLGERDFTIEYKLTNFVMNLKDNKQAIYWQFINPDMDPIDKVNISITNKKGFVYSTDNTKIWGFGYTGQTEITPNELKLYNTTSLSGSNYVVLLSIFPENTFATTYNHNKTSLELEEQAKEGSSFTSSKDSGNGILNKILDKIIWVIVAIVAVVINLLFIAFAIVGISELIASKKCKDTFKPTGKYEYYREVPYEKHFLDTTRLFEYDKEDLISAMILKWIKEEKMKVVESEKGIFFKRKTHALKLNDSENIEFDEEIEKRLWRIFRAVAGENHVIEENEFDGYMKENYEKYYGWLYDVTERSEEIAFDNNWVEERDAKILFIKNSKIYATEEGSELIDKIVGFKKYLLDFSILNERSSTDVKLWEDYMIWAAYMGIAEEVEKEFNKLNPSYRVYGDEDTSYIRIANTFSYNMNHSAASSVPSSSDGGGGSSSSGGGGGSFGGSSGGGTR